jgi:parallel beta-helix repeat protein
MNGAHRVGFLIRGANTEVDLLGNLITGTGAKTSGWAENGIQVDQGATADIIGNTVEGHWWDGESNWASTGILIFDSGSVEITNNDLHNNEFSIALYTSDSKVTGNKTSSDIESQSSLNFQAYGALVGGSNNHLAGNSFSATNGAVGIYIFPGVESNDVTGNRIKGFDFLIFDGGTDSKVRGTPAPPNSI